MEPIKVTLCPYCNECPEVEITDHGVTIGEEENSVRLSHAEWNELVRLVKTGDLREV
jgi:sarcosine oxidase delta subunit